MSPAAFVSAHRPSEAHPTAHHAVSLTTTTTTIFLPPSSYLTSLHLVFYCICLFLTHTHTPPTTHRDKAKCRYDRLASPRPPDSPCLKVRRARFRLPSPVHQRRHPPTSSHRHLCQNIDNRHDDTAIIHPPSATHSLGSPRLFLATASLAYAPEPPLANHLRPSRVAVPTFHIYLSYTHAT
jgi:hypothetical protein